MSDHESPAVNGGATFDGIQDDRIGTMPLPMTLLFVGLVVFGVAFAAYYLLSDWSSAAELEAKMQAHEAAVVPPAE